MKALDILEGSFATSYPNYILLLLRYFRIHIQYFRETAPYIIQFSPVISKKYQTLLTTTMIVSQVLQVLQIPIGYRHIIKMNSVS